MHVRYRRRYSVRSGLALVFLAGLVAMLLGRDVRAAVLEVPAQYATIQAAIDAAAAGDTVLVAAGVYEESIDFAGKAITVLAGGTPYDTVIRGTAFFQNGEGANSVLSGFNMAGFDVPGIYCEGSSPTILANRITGHLVDAGVHCVDASPRIEANEIRGNQPSGLLCEGSSNPVITANTFLRNGGNAGGAIRLENGSSPHIFDNEFEDNNAGSADATGGAIVCYSGASLRIEDNEFIGNAVNTNQGRGGGAIALIETQAVVRGNRFVSSLAANPGGAIAVFDDSSVRIEDNVFLVNRASPILAGPVGGGAVMVEDSHADIVGNRLSGNTSYVTGGAVTFLGSTGSVIGNDFDQNESLRFGGGLFVLDSDVDVVNNFFFKNRSRRNGGGIRVVGSSNVAITHNTLIDNIARDGGGGISLAQAAVDVTNTIVWGNTVNLEGPVEDIQIEDQLDEGYVANFCCVEGGYPGVGNIDEDPRVAGVSSFEADLHLRLDSPCIDAGTNGAPALPLTDIDGDDRIVDGDGDTNALPDIGADELRREIAVRYGNVGGELYNLLYVDGSAGDAERVVTVDSGADALASILAPSGGGSGLFVIHANFGEPTLESIVEIRNVGPIGFELLLPLGATPAAIWNNVGKVGKLGASTGFGGAPIPDPDPAPIDFFTLPDPALVPGTTVTFQGVIIDPLSEGSRGGSITNAVVLRVE